MTRFFLSPRIDAGAFAFGTSMKRFFLSPRIDDDAFAFGTWSFR